MKAIFIVCVWVALFIGLAVVGRPAQLPEVKPVNFQWALFHGKFSEGPYFTLRFEDGRVYVFREASITSAKLFPPEWAKELNMKHTFIEIVCGGQGTRIDVADTKSGEDLLSHFLSHGELIDASPNWKPLEAP